MQNDVSKMMREDVDPDGTLMELQRLIECYQLADFDDKSVIWAVLNKYARYVSE